MITEGNIRTLIATKDLAVARAILALHERPNTFTAEDKEFLSSVAEALPRWNNHMTPRQLARARKLLPKYVPVLVEIANARVEPLAPNVPIVVIPADERRVPFGAF